MSEIDIKQIIRDALAIKEQADLMLRAYAIMKKQIENEFGDYYITEERMRELIK